jgi:hypothetical protein
MEVQTEGGNRAENDQAEVVAAWVADLVALGFSFIARLYRQRWAAEGQAGQAQDGPDRR